MDEFRALATGCRANHGWLNDPALDSLSLTDLRGGERGTRRFTSTKALMVAVLEDGIRSYLSSRIVIRREAEYWITSGDRRQPFAFHVVCETLGLEPGAVRAAIQRLRDRGTHGGTLRRSPPNVRRNFPAAQVSL